MHVHVVARTQGTTRELGAQQNRGIGGKRQGGDDVTFKNTGEGRG